MTILLVKAYYLFVDFHRPQISSLSVFFFFQLVLSVSICLLFSVHNMKPSVHLLHVFRIHALRLYSISKALAQGRPPAKSADFERGREALNV